jgi:hypothetical protein
VFFDETPDVYTDAIGAFYDGIDREVKENAGYKGDRTVSPPLSSVRMEVFSR